MLETAFLSWVRHEMETFSALLALREGNVPVIGGFPSQRPVSRTELWCFLFVHEQRAEQTIESPVIWDAIAFIMTSLYGGSYNCIHIVSAWRVMKLIKKGCFLLVIRTWDTEIPIFDFSVFFFVAAILWTLQKREWQNLFGDISDLYLRHHDV